MQAKQPLSFISWVKELLLTSALAKVYQRAGIRIENFPEGVILEWRDGFWTGVNYSDKPYNVAVPAKAKVLIGKKVLKPADVVVWKE